MRTTVDLPDELYREAKTTAVQRGVPLKTLLTSGLRRELRSPDSPSSTPSWVRATHALHLEAEEAEQLQKRFDQLSQEEARTAGAGDDHWA